MTRSLRARRALAATAAVVVTLTTGAPARASDTRTLAYIGYATGQTGSIAVVDVATGAVVAGWDLDRPPNGLTPKPDGRYLYVADGNVHVFDATENDGEEVVSIDVGGFANKVAFSPDATLAYVAEGSAGAGGSRGGIYVTDVATDAIVGRIRAVAWPTDLAISADGRTAYALNFTAGALSVVDLATKTVTATITGVADSSSRLSLAGDKVYVAGKTKLTEVGPDNRIARQTDLAGNYARGLAITPNGRTAYVSAAYNQVGALFTVDLATMAVTRRADVGAWGHLAVTPDGSRVFLNDTVGERTSVIDTANGYAVDQLHAPAGARPTSLAVFQVPGD
ncbi:hypothetical protein [Actinosynnema sp. NPDC020468]|uniref:hypothetical protein n=1 Tax=Actinosynnema sp. NPDC020468 TaxID=3154488 RepID=UPI00340D92EA